MVWFSFRIFIIIPLEFHGFSFQEPLSLLPLTQKSRVIISFESNKRIVNTRGKGDKLCDLWFFHCLSWTVIKIILVREPSGQASSVISLASRSRPGIRWSSVKISFANFSQRFSTTTSYLKRRFSQGDLSGENEGDEDFTGGAGPSAGRVRTAGGGPTFPGRPTSAVPPSTEPPKSLSGVGSTPTTTGAKRTSVTSAPTSPTRTSASTTASSGVSSFLSRATSITTSVREVTSNVSNVAGQLKDRIKDTPAKSRILLVVDDNQTDWWVILYECTTSCAQC